MEPTNHFLSTPTRQSVVAIFLIIYRFVKTAVRQFWPLLLLVWVNPNASKGIIFSVAMTAIGGFILMGALLNYFRFFFYIKNNELLVESGVFRRTKLNIPFDRIQSINFEQNLIHQIFNVVSVEIDTAGSKGNEFSISALSRKKALALQEYIMSNKSSEKEGLQTDDSAEQEVGKQEPLLRLTPADLLKIGVSQNHLRTAAVVFAFFVTLFDEVEDVLGNSVFEKFEESFGALTAGGVYMVLILVPFFLIASFIISLVLTVIRYFDFAVWRTGDGFRMSSGLFNRIERAAFTRKIQFIRWSTNPIKRYFGLFSVQLRQASSAELSRRQAFNIPGCYSLQLEVIQKEYFSNISTSDFEAHSISSLFVWRRALYLGLLPGGALALGACLFKLPFYLLVLACLLPPLSWLYFYWYQKLYRYEVGETALKISKGVISKDYTLLLWRKVQAVKIQKSIYQRRKNLADIILYTAAGSIRIPYMETEKAYAIQDYALYCVETDTRGWM